MALEEFGCWRTLADNGDGDNSYKPVARRGAAHGGQANPSRSTPQLFFSSSLFIADSTDPFPLQLGNLSRNLSNRCLTNSPFFLASSHRRILGSENSLTRRNRFESAVGHWKYLSRTRKPTSHYYHYHHQDRTTRTPARKAGQQSQHKNPQVHLTTKKKAVQSSQMPPPSRDATISSPNRARLPFRYQHTMSYYHPAAAASASSSSSTSGTTNEKQGEAAVPMDDFNFDEKSGIAQQQPQQRQASEASSSGNSPQQSRASRSQRASRSGHVRTTSRDDPHWQSNGSSEARGRSTGRSFDSPASSSSSRTSQQQRQPALYYPHRYHSHPPPPPPPVYHRHSLSVSTDARSPTTCCGQGVSPRFKAWVPLGAWIATSLAFLIAIGWYKDEVFLGLEKLSDWIRTEGYEGQAILFFLIFITTFPPMPLYSTLIVLSGYCLGAWHGAVLSYFAALSGAVVVFLLSRTYLRSHLAEIIASAPTSIKRAIRAVEKQPKLLFLIRLSPYPYNLMNALLATSRISFSTYTWCTALSLFKVIIHTTIGASIHKFSDYHTHSHTATNDGDTTESGNDEGDGEDWNKIFTIFGVILCIVVLVYLALVARRAVDDVDDDFDEHHLPTSHSRGRGRGRIVRDTDEEEGESVAFLSPMAQDDSRRPSFDFARLVGGTEASVMMESPLRPAMPLPRTASPFKGVHPS